MSRSSVEHYIGRATDFYRGMRLTREDDAFRWSAALLAIHSAISYSDALRVGLGNDELASDNHQKASVELKTLLRARHLGVDEISGIKNLEFLIGKKSFVSYGAQHLDSDGLDAIVLSAERFAIWVALIARQLKIEGWRHDGA